MANCKNCKCLSTESMLDILSFTLSDLGVKHLEGIPDQELLELINRKLRMLFNLCVAAGVDEVVLREAMNG
jgi:hypothetical protein